MVSWGATNVAGERVFQLHPGQTAIMRSQARFKAAIAGTGGGKTVLGPVWLMSLIAEKPDGWYLVVAPTYPIMSRATAPTLIRMFEGTDFEGRYIESRNKYLLPGGGIIWFLSADNAGGLEGGQFNGAWIDEGGQISYDAWVAIQGRLGQHEAPALITTTPYGRNWLKKQFFDRYLQGDKDYYVKQWGSADNPAYPRSEFERARRTMPLQRFAMRYQGLFVKMSGLVYPDLDKCIVNPFEPPPGQLIGGIDFGWNDPFAALAGTYFIADEGDVCRRLGLSKGDDVIYIWYERYKRTTPLKQHAHALPQGVLWYADPSRPDSINELCTADHTTTGIRHEIIVGVDAINQRIYSRRLLISKACRATIAEAESYAYPEKDDETHGDKPIDGFNHALDSLRYLVMGIDSGGVATSGEAA